VRTLDWWRRSLERLLPEELGPRMESQVQ